LPFVFCLLESGAVRRICTDTDFAFFFH
jgi:hypothetical protein